MKESVSEGKKRRGEIRKLFHIFKLEVLLQLYIVKDFYIMCPRI